MEHLQNSLDVIAARIFRISEVLHCRSLYSERALDPPAPLMILSPEHPDEKEHKGPLSAPPGVLNHGINTWGQNFPKRDGKDNRTESTEINGIFVGGVFFFSLDGHFIVSS
jgi:hypothetical protein